MLAEEVLHLSIQRGGTPQNASTDGEAKHHAGHDSIEDAATALKLAKHYIIGRKRLAARGSLLTREDYEIHWKR